MTRLRKRAFDVYCNAWSVDMHGRDPHCELKEPQKPKTVCSGGLRQSRPVTLTILDKGRVEGGDRQKNDIV